MIRIALLICLVGLVSIDGSRRRCINSGILFPDKILGSPIVVYGESIGKRVYVDTDTDFLFNVTLRVDCILKGQDVEHQIEITQAGIKAGHMACHSLEPGAFYIVFLEKWGMSSNGYRPLDYHERLVDNMTYELLEKTCHLMRLSPLHASRDNCPNVSLNEYCPHDEIDVSIMPKQKNAENTYANTRPSYFNSGNQFYLQSNVTIPRDTSGAMRTGDHRSNSASSWNMFENAMLLSSIFLAAML